MDKSDQQRQAPRNETRFAAAENTSVAAPQAGTSAGNSVKEESYIKEIERVELKQPPSRLVRVRDVVSRYFCYMGLVSVLVWPTQGKAEPTAAEFLMLYEKSDDDQRRMMLLLLSNMASGMQWVNTHIESVRNQDKLFCLPSNLPVAREQIYLILKDTTEKNDYVRNLPHGLVLLKGLQDMFPCPDVARP